MSASELGVVPALLAAWGFPENAVTASVESAAGQVARWTHRMAEVDDTTLSSNVLAMKRTCGAAWRRRGGREEAASLRPGEIGLLTEGSYGAWRFEQAGGATYDVTHVYLPSRRLERLAAQDGGRSAELQDSMKLDDPILRMLMREVDLAVDQTHARRLYMESLLTTIAARLLERCGAGAPRRPARGGLAPWQLRRACEAIMAEIDGATPASTISPTSPAVPRPTSAARSSSRPAWRPSTGWPSGGSRRPRPCSRRAASRWPRSRWRSASPPSRSSPPPSAAPRA